jgi:ribonucleoside-triphosphate reductase (thioredoxin)
MSDISRKILSDITVYMKYAKYRPELNRRETWQEIVDRNKQMHLKKFPKLSEEIEEAYKYVYEYKDLPSMRSMQFAGKAIDINNARLFNCSYLPMDDVDSFCELMFLLLSGCGVGYSVQRHHVEKLPEIKKPTRSKRYLIGDSIMGWSDAVKALTRSYLKGLPFPVFDYSDIRAKGIPLKTSGGKAPGPEPLREALEKVNKIFSRKENGDKLTPLEVHDINCYLSDAVLSAGIRRSAMISLFDFDDEEMLTCKGNLKVEQADQVINKNGDFTTFYVSYRSERIPVTLHNDAYEEFLANGILPWYNVAPERGRANNSAVILRHKIKKSEFKKFWNIVKDSGCGEPGFMMSNDKNMGLNPCGEISLKPNQFCNLVTINVSDIETQEELNARAKATALIATLQASYTDFHYLRDVWKTTTDKEALIGVSMTGLASTKALSLDLEEAAEVVLKENERVAKLIGINKAARATCVKPEGTSSTVLGSSSGIHAWHSEYYIRRIRVGKDEPIYQYLNAYHPELLEDDHFRPATQAIIKVPIKAPEGAITRNESALDLLSRVSHVWNSWVKRGHRKGSNVNNVSTTVTVKADEWDQVGEWMWEHRDEYTALSVLPHDGGTYIQAPFTEITQEEYEEALKDLSKVDISMILETEDGTSLQDQLACAGGACEIP